MRAVRTRGISAFLFVLLVVLAGCIPTGKSPTAPVAVTDYPVYFNIETTYYQYAPDTKDLESFEIPIGSRHNRSVSADGKQLWIPTSTEVNIVDIASRTVIGQVPYQDLVSPVSFSPDSRLAALFGPTLTLVDTRTLEVVFSDAGAGGSFSGGAFSNDGNRLYCIQNGEVFIVNIDNGFSTGRQAIESYPVNSIWPSPDETHWYLTQDSYSGCTILVYDVLAGKVIHVEETAPGPITTHMTPDGSRLYYTVMGLDLLFEANPPFSFAVMDLEPPYGTRTVKIPIPVGYWPYFPFGRFAVTPDGNWIVGTWFQTRNLICYNLQDGAVSEVLSFDDYPIWSIFSQQYR